MFTDSSSLLNIINLVSKSLKDVFKTLFSTFSYDPHKYIDSLIVSSDHYHQDGYLVPSPWCGFSFEAAFQLKQEA